MTAGYCQLLEVKRGEYINAAYTATALNWLAHISFAATYQERICWNGDLKVAWSLYS